MYLLGEQVLGGMFNVVIGERSHGVVAVIIFRLVADVDSSNTACLCGGLEVLREKLSLLVEVVTGTLGTTVSTRTRRTRVGRANIQHRSTDRAVLPSTASRAQWNRVPSIWPSGRHRSSP